MLKENVLSGKRNFDRVYKKGKSTAHKYVVVFFKENGLSYGRVAFVASKKVGKAVTRNRARIHMKESVRLIDIELNLYLRFYLIAADFILPVPSILYRHYKNTGFLKVVIWG